MRVHCSRQQPADVHHAVRCGGRLRRALSRAVAACMQRRAAMCACMNERGPHRPWLRHTAVTPGLSIPIRSCQSQQWGVVLAVAARGAVAQEVSRRMGGLRALARTFTWTCDYTSV
eukprot:130806-Chlamydomonas_euryale.AAC.10